jgi:hypothetical protein
MACLDPTNVLQPSDTRFPGCNPAIPRHLLWASFDDVGTVDEDRTWIELDNRLRSWDVQGGRDSELEEVDATNATYVLDDRDRDLDPTNTASPHYPKVIPNRRIWHRVDINGGVYDVFKGWVNGWGPEWNQPADSDNRARLRCTDGKKRLRSNLEAASPDAEDYNEVVEVDEPFFYGRLGEPEGTKVVHHARRRKRRKRESRRHFRRHGVKHWTTRETLSEVEGVAGEAGTYVNTPLLGALGLIMGDSDTCVKFRVAESEYVSLGAIDPFGGTTGPISLEAWVAFTDLADDYGIISGSYSSTDLTDVWKLTLNNSSNQIFFEVLDSSTRTATSAASSIVAGTRYHIVGVYTSTGTSGSIKVYLNGALSGSSTWGSGGAAINNLGNDIVYIGRWNPMGTPLYTNAKIDEVAIYEKELSAERVAAHYRAGLLGFDSALTGQRITTTLTLAGTEGTFGIQPGVRLMPADRYAGREPLDLVQDAVDGEGRPSLFFFSRSGNPTFLDSSHRGAAPYNSPRFTFGGSNLKFRNAHLSDSDSFLFNVVRGTRESGDVTFAAEDAASISQHGRLVLPMDSLPLANDADTQSYVNDLLAKYKDPLVRIERFNLQSKWAAEAMLSLDLGDCIRVQLQPPGGGPPFDQVSYVEQRHLWQDQPGTVIEGEFAISTR